MLKVGTAAIDITPDLGTHLAGSAAGERRSAATIHDRLYAKALAAECGGKRICIVSMDLIIITGEYTALIRNQASQRFGLDPDAILIHPTQTHSAPSIGHFMLDPDFPLETPPGQEFLRGGDPAYYEITWPLIVEVIGLALTKLQPVRLAIGRTERPDRAFNRRGEGHIDPELAVADLRGLDGQSVAMLLHYTAHPVNLFCRGMGVEPAAYRTVSADWPGVWAAMIQQKFGLTHLPLVINGSCGNINPGNWGSIAEWDLERYSAGLAESAIGLIQSIEPREVTSIDYRIRHIELDYRQIPAARLAAVENLLSANPTPPRNPQTGQVDPTWFAAASTRSVAYCQRRMPRFKYEIQAMRIGDLAIVGLPGEPFAEGQVDLKRRSPARLTLVAHLTSHYVGYLPTREAYARSGHEANDDCTYWAKVAPGSLEKVVDEAVDLLNEMKLPA